MTVYLCARSQMATRLLVRRIWSASAKDIHRLPAAALLSSSLSSRSSLNTSVHTQSFLSPPRSLSLTSHRCISFNVQDNDDFTERVINSDLPVLVDFHAQCVFSELIQGVSSFPSLLILAGGGVFMLLMTQYVLIAAAHPVWLHTAQNGSSESKASFHSNTTTSHSTLSQHGV